MADRHAAVGRVPLHGELLAFGFALLGAVLFGGAAALVGLALVAGGGALLGPVVETQSGPIESLVAGAVWLAGMGLLAWGAAIGASLASHPAVRRSQAWNE